MQDASSKQQTKQKYKPNHQQTGLPPHSALPIRGKTNKNLAQMWSYRKLTQTTGPTLSVRVSHLVVPDSLWPHGLQPTRLSVHEIFQARILEWVAISFSRGSSQPRDRTQVSCTAGRFFTIMTWSLKKPWRRLSFIYSFNTCLQPVFTVAKYIRNDN